MSISITSTNSYILEWSRKFPLRGRSAVLALDRLAKLAAISATPALDSHDDK
jgi:hypothetical protein